ncbi:MAG: DNA ligase (NAD+) [Candidatus Berkelbacteria bacterium Licking1014_7]|uniref:DNA ligase n=1 Tax=Candidatus Berkelbacteria bacterium Licking1014_7 TaxID=2017147 RepID=A0A554LIB2_9BACT|nr:MAG: DNA ligase (NAD+) [Candidatus Berkelbacteria bacterium Licking1014_7]
MDKIKKNVIKARIEKLKTLIEKNRYAYHVLDKPRVSDAIDDSLKHELADLEKQYPEFITADSPTQRVGGRPLDKFKKVQHKQPMLSLIDSFSAEELEDWQKRNARLLHKKPDGYFAEIKIDGLAVSLHYQNGKFIQGLTRGDGWVGEDVIQNLKTVESIPLKILNSKFEVRGEVYMKKTVFEMLNKKYKKAGKPLLANPRNGAAGSIRQLDPKLAAERKLSFFAYDIITNQKLKNYLNPKTHSDKHKLLQKLGFPVAEGRECRDLNEVKSFYQIIQKKRDRLEFNIDGIWVGVNDNRTFEKLAVAGKSPRAAVAYKFPAEEKTTMVKSIINQVGRSGKITPVAVMEPTQIAGSIVSRATLHNWQEVLKKDVRIADTVIVRKAGDIIPEVVSVIKELRPKNSKKNFPPVACPNCQQKLVKQKSDQVDLFCPNNNCKIKTIRRLEHFVSKKGFDIDGLGKKIIAQLFEAGLIKNETDIFNLKESDLESLERFEQKSAQNIIFSIEQSKKISLSKFLFALGIKHIGEITSNQIARLVDNNSNIIEPTKVFNKLSKYDFDDWQKMYDIGPEASQTLFEFFQSKKKRSQFNNFSQLGIKIILPPKIKQTLLGKSFVITGTLEKLTRDEAQNQIRLRGGNVSSAVSKETDFLIAGANPGSKYEKAKKLGVKIIDEKQLDRLWNKECQPDK